MPVPTQRAQNSSKSKIDMVPEEGHSRIEDINKRMGNPNIKQSVWGCLGVSAG